MTNPAIRLPTRADIEAIGRIVSDTDMFPAEMLDDMMAPYFGGDVNELWFVIGETPSAVAYAVPERMTNGSWNQLLIAVDPNLQGRGLGRALMRNLETTVADRGARLILVETSGLPEFERTRAFYRAIGYTEQACIPDFYDDGDDKIIFTRKLAH